MKILLSIMLCLTIHIHSATIAQIESFKAGPNPFIIGTSDLVINFVSSTDISSEYYLFTATGELILTESIDEGSTSSQSGTNEFILATSSELSSLDPGIYILYAIYTYETTTIKEKAFIIAN